MHNSSLYDIVTPLVETCLNKKARIVRYKLRWCMRSVYSASICLSLIYLETFSGKIILKHSFSIQISSHL